MKYKLLIFLLFSIYIFAKENTKPYFTFSEKEETCVYESDEKFLSTEFGNITFEGIGAESKALIFKSGSIYFKIFSGEKEFKITRKPEEKILPYTVKLSEKEEEDIVKIGEREDYSSIISVSMDKRYAVISDGDEGYYSTYFIDKKLKKMEYIPISPDYDKNSPFYNGKFYIIDKSHITCLDINKKIRKDYYFIKSKSEYDHSESLLIKGRGIRFFTQQGILYKAVNGRIEPITEHVNFAKMSNIVLYDNKIFVVRTIFEEDTINTIIDNRLIVYDLKTKERKDIYLKTEDSVFDKLFISNNMLFMCGTYFYSGACEYYLPGLAVVPDISAPNKYIINEKGLRQNTKYVYDLSQENKYLFKLENDDENDYIVTYSNNKLNTEKIKKDSVNIKGLKKLITDDKKEEGYFIYPKIIEVE